MVVMANTVGSNPTFWFGDIFIVMETKICNKCEVEKPVEDFNWKKKDVKRRATCRVCTKLAGKKHYTENKDKYAENRERNRQELKEWFRDYKSKQSCKCGENRPPCLDFHHVDSSTKELELSTAVHNGWSIDRVMSEIKKCVVVCKNCHAMIHHNE
jgi:hypothetical protein